MEVSKISAYEYITINATWHYLNNQRQFNCDEQIKRYEKYPTQLKDFLNKNGCQDRIIKAIRYSLNNINFYSCVCNFRNPFMSLYIEMHDIYKKGNMPYKGTFNEQPAQIIEIFNVLDMLYHERDQKLIEAHNKANQSGGKNG